MSRHPTDINPDPDVIVIGAGFGGLYTIYLLQECGFDVKGFEEAPDIGGVCKFDVKRHIQFNSRVVGAEFHPSTDRWAVRTQDGNITYSRFVVFCTGFAAKPYIPSIKGLESFKGIWHHTAHWPQEGVELKGKRVAVIGNGASGVQLIQECAAEVEQLIVFQRTPNLALSMPQKKLTEESQIKEKGTYPDQYRFLRSTSAGYPCLTIPKNGADLSREERTAVFEELWAAGAFHIRPNVKLVSLKDNPIIEITERAVRTSDGVEHEVDVIVLATGFDAITGSLARIDIKGIDDRLIGEKWASKLQTYIGMTVVNYPNMFFSYGPQTPTALSTRPVCSEIQPEWIVNCITYLRDNHITRIEPSREAEEEWTNNVNKIFSGQLFSEAKSWYTGANIPGKKVQSLNFTGGIPAYLERISTVAEKGYEGFILAGKPVEATG
ncbi:hypothetical protein M422DRAFT_244330 [Sphaerobolus stellatus SS14]|nr:hypothetical protein M422DRAFT_244330 [Sphaerobolus stellatus SS14]